QKLPVLSVVFFRAARPTQTETFNPAIRSALSMTLIANPFRVCAMTTKCCSEESTVASAEGPLISKTRPVTLLDSPGDFSARTETAAPSRTCVVPIPALVGGPTIPRQPALDPGAFARGCTMSKIG